MSLTPAIIQAMTADVTDKLILACLTATHPNFGTIRLVNDTQPLTRNGQVFEAFPFSVVLPPDSAEADRLMEVRIANVTLNVLRLVRSAAGSDTLPIVTIEIVDIENPNGAVATYSDFEVRAAPYDTNVLTLSLSLDSFLAEPFPAGVFTPANFPGMF